MKRKRPPMQPVVIAGDGTVRFQENAIVRYLLDWASPKGMSMNDLALIPFPRSDFEQFAQLIGYSVSGFGDLSYVRRESIARADEKVKKLR